MAQNALRRPALPERNTLILAAIGLALLVALVLQHRLSQFQIIYFCVLIPSIILHEISHGVVALIFGDDTAKRLGRLSLNPVRHVDPVGTLIVPGVLSLTGLGAYGWAKPVPVNVNRLRHPRNETVLVSLIGPLTNFFLAFLLSLLFIAVTPQPLRLPIADTALSNINFVPGHLISKIVLMAGFANIMLGIFNCIPCPPLDGAALLERFIPVRMLPDYYRMQRFLMFLPFALILLFHNQWSAFVDHVLSWWTARLA